MATASDTSILPDPQRESVPGTPRRAMLSTLAIAGAATGEADPHLAWEREAAAI